MSRPRIRFVQPPNILRVKVSGIISCNFLSKGAMMPVRAVKSLDVRIDEHAPSAWFCSFFLQPCTILFIYKIVWEQYYQLFNEKLNTSHLKLLVQTK